MAKENKSISVSGELYDALQQLKTVFSQMTGEELKSEEEVIGILISGFLESMNAYDGEEGEDHECGCGHDHGDDHGHDHGDEGCCGGQGKGKCKTDKGSKIITK